MREIHVNASQKERDKETSFVFYAIQFPNPKGRLW